MTSTLWGRGANPNKDLVKEVAGILYCKSEQNSDKGEGVQNPENFADVICTCPLTTIILRIGLCLCTLFTINAYLVGLSIF